MVGDDVDSGDAVAARRVDDRGVDAGDRTARPPRWPDLGRRAARSARTIGVSDAGADAAVLQRLERSCTPAEPVPWDLVLDWPNWMLKQRGDREAEDDQRNGGDQPRLRTMAGPRRSSPWRRRLPCGCAGMSTRGPTEASSAGSRVSTTATEHSGISMPPIAHAAQQGHRHHDQRHQADRDGDAGGEDRVAGVTHARSRTASSLVWPWRDLLTPAGDDQQRVVDGDTEPDQRDQELDDEADVGERGQQQHDQERGQDRHRRDQQRHQGQQRGEDEGQHDQRAQGAEQASRSGCWGRCRCCCHRACSCW